MNSKQEKAQLLHDIATGKKTIADLKPRTYHFWQQDYEDVTLFHCEHRKINVNDVASQPGVNIFTYYEKNFPLPDEAIYFMQSHQPIQATAQIIAHYTPIPIFNIEKDRYGWVSIISNED